MIALVLIGVGSWSGDIAARLVPGSGYYGECGYDLKGNTSGSCPECATPTPGRG